jgi:hypothetical protein
MLTTIGMVFLAMAEKVGGRFSNAAVLAADALEAPKPVWTTLGSSSHASTAARHARDEIRFLNIRFRLLRPASTSINISDFYAPFKRGKSRIKFANPHANGYEGTSFAMRII